MTHCTRCLLLEERVAELEELLGLKIEPPLHLRLTRNERRMFGLLLARRGGATMEALMTARRPHPGREADDLQQSTEVQLCTLRKKLRAEGVVVERYVGGYADVYRITTETRPAAEALVNNKKEPTDGGANLRQPEGPAAPGAGEAAQGAGGRACNHRGAARAV